MTDRILALTARMGHLREIASAAAGHAPCNREGQRKTKMHKISVSVFEPIDHQELVHTSGGMVIPPRDLREPARVLDAVMPSSVSLQLGPVGASWNVPPKPVEGLLDRAGYQSPPPPTPAKPSRWGWLAGGAS